MKDEMMRRVIALVMIAAVSACSTVETETVPPPPAELCAERGLWAVLSHPITPPAGSLPTPPTRGSAAAAGAKTGAAASISTGAIVAGAMLEDASKQSTDWVAGAGVLLAGVALGAGVVVAPVAAIIGAGVGAASAPSEAEIAAAEQSMTNALDVAKPVDAVRAQVMALARELAGPRLYDCVGLGSLDACRQQAPEPVAVVLTMQVRPPYFEVEGSVAPQFRLLLSARAEAFRTGDAATVYSRAWVYRGAQHGYSDLAADDAAKFRAELATAEKALAEKVVDDLLIGGREEVHASAEQPEGTVWTVSAGLISREAGRP